jgi:uncharacterized protein YlxW (UPF0749 family)
MITPLYEIVLVAVMVTQGATGGPLALQYQPLDYFNSLSTCQKEERRLQARVREQEKIRAYICLKVDRN